MIRHLGVVPLVVSMVACGAPQPPGAQLPPILEGRAVLPARTYAPGPPSGAARAAANGITFPTPSQPVEGVSALLTGRRAGEYLGMLDNGFGSKENSRDFLIRAYYFNPDFKTASGGRGSIAAGEFIAFRDPNRKLSFPIVHEASTERLLTGGDIDPESIQRDLNGNFWVGDEFGPWILHFDAAGVLLDAPYPVPGTLMAVPVAGDLMSPSHPFLTGAPSVPTSRGFEAMAISPDGAHLYPILEGKTEADPDGRRRMVFEFSIPSRAFTSRTWWYRTEEPAHMVADAVALDADRLAVIERDAGFGLNALFRRVYVVDLSRVDDAGFLTKHLVVDLAAISDPDRVSLPPVHPGDVGLGDPFRVTCESIEAILALDRERLLFGCDNNLPKEGRNPVLADDTEFIVVRVPGLGGARR